MAQSTRKSSSSKSTTKKTAIKSKTLNAALDMDRASKTKTITITKPTRVRVKKVVKPSLEKYYISEKPIKEINDIVFNFKKALQYDSTSYETFMDALNRFITIAELSNNPCRVWFHREGAFRGSVDLTKAYIIRQRLSHTNIENKNVIQYIESEDLVDKGKVSEKVEIDYEREQRLLNRAVEFVDLNVENSINRYVQDIMVPDVRTYSPGNNVVVERVQANTEDNLLTVWYHLEKDIEKHHLVSEQGIQTLRGFKIYKEEEPQVIEKLKIIEKVIETPSAETKVPDNNTIETVIETKPVETIQEVKDNINDHLDEVTIDIPNKEAKYADEIMPHDVNATLAGYEVIIEKLEASNSDLKVWYHLTKDSEISNSKDVLLSGFKEHELVIVEPTVTQTKTTTTKTPQDIEWKTTPIYTYQDRCQPQNKNTQTSNKSQIAKKKEPKAKVDGKFIAFAIIAALIILGCLATVTYLEFFY